MHLPDANHGHEGHDHSSASVFFIDQLCTIGVAGAYGGVMISMYLLRGSGDDSRSLMNLVAPWIQYLILGCAGALLFFAFWRAVAVWRAAGAHSHHHHHDHDHDHGHDHEHHWSPLRYIPLVIPLMLFFLDLPNAEMIRRYERDLIERSGGYSGEYTASATMGETVATVGLVSANPSGLATVGGLQFAVGTAIEFAEEEADIPPDFKPDLGMLQQVANAPTPDQRLRWREFKRVEVEGMFVPATPDGRYFRLVRLKMVCCMNDAQPAIMLAGSRRPLPHIKPQQWVAVQGRLDFMPTEDGKWMPVMRAFKVRPKKTPPNPYLR